MLALLRDDGGYLPERGYGRGVDAPQEFAASLLLLLASRALLPAGLTGSSRLVRGAAPPLDRPALDRKSVV